MEELTIMKTFFVKNQTILQTILQPILLGCAIIFVSLLFSCATPQAPVNEAPPAEPQEQEEETTEAEDVVLEELPATELPEVESPQQDSSPSTQIVRLYDKYIIDSHTRGVQGLAYFSSVLVSGGWDNHMFAHNTQRGIEIARVLDAHGSDVIDLAFDPQGEFLVSVGLDRTIRFWSTQTYTEIAQIGDLVHNAIGVDVFRYSTGSVLVAVALLTGEIAVYNYETKEKFASFYHDSYATNVAFSRDGQLLASVGNDQVVRLWSLTEKKAVRTFVGHTAKINTVGFNADGRFLVSGGWDNTFIVWDIASGNAIAAVDNVHTDAIEAISFSKNGEFIVSGGRDGLISIWNGYTGELLKTYDTGSVRVYNVIFNDDISEVAVAGYDKTVRVYDFSFDEIR